MFRGEALRLRPPLRFRSLPGVLRPGTPLTAPGASSAAVAPAGLVEAAPALLRVLPGRPGVQRPRKGRERASSRSSASINCWSAAPRGRGQA